MLALGRLYLASGDLDAAMFQLTALLRVDKSNNDATMVSVCGRRRMKKLGTGNRGSM